MSQQPIDIGEIDRLRTRDPDAALDAYGTLDPGVVAGDIERVEWIVDRVPRTHLSSFRPLFEHVVARPLSATQRGAVHLLAMHHWNRGDFERAESLWRQGFETGRAAADARWLSSMTNLALTYERRGRSFEALVLIGVAIRVAAELRDDATLAFSRVRRANALLRFDADDAAERELHHARAIVPRVQLGPRRDVIASTVLRTWARIHRHRGHWDLALRAIEENIVLLRRDVDAGARHEIAVLAGAETLRVQLQFELEPERGPHWIATLERLPDRLQLDERWRPVNQYNVDELRLKHALRESNSAAVASEDSPDRDAILATATALLDQVEAQRQDDERIAAALWLGQVFDEWLACFDEAHRAYDIAASAVLTRIVQLERATRDCEIADATPEDWSTLNEHRRQLVRQQSRLCRAITEMWKPGEPAFELIVADNQLISLCAWCERVETSDGLWLPLTQFFPGTDTFRTTHVMCESCRDQIIAQAGHCVG